VRPRKRTRNKINLIKMRKSNLINLKRKILRELRIFLLSQLNCHLNNNLNQLSLPRKSIDMVTRKRREYIDTSMVTNSIMRTE